MFLHLFYTYSSKSVILVPSILMKFSLNRPKMPPGVVCKCYVGVVYDLVCELAGSRRIQL